MNNLKLGIFSTIAIVLVGCSNSSPVDLQDNTVLDLVTYQNSVKPIMDSNCISCHGTVPTNGAPMPLTTYENVKASVLSMNTINRITRNLGDPLMMPLGGPKLTQAKIDAIIKWQTQGFQN